MNTVKTLTDKSRIYRNVSLFLVCFLTTGCATIVKGTTQDIPVSSDPPGADIIVDGQLVGTTPADVAMKRKRDHLVVIRKPNYESKSLPVVKNIGGAVWGNILAGGLIGWGVDATSGAQNNLSPETIYVKLEPTSANSKETASGANASTAIARLNELDAMRENDQISGEEYARARVGLLREYFPEMAPEAEGAKEE